MCGLRLLRSYICFATSQISLLTKQTLFFRLFVFCSFAPSPHGYSVSRGVPKIPKKSEFLDSNSLKTARIWWIFDVSYEVLKILVYLDVHGFSGSRKNSKRRELRRKSRFWPNKLFSFVCLSFARLLLLPTGTQYPAGSPKSLKSQNF